MLPTVSGDPPPDGGTVSLSGIQKGETDSSVFNYTVSYSEGQKSQESNVMVYTATNSRPGLVLKKTNWDGEAPLAGAAFTLTEGSNNLIGTFMLRPCDSIIQLFWN